MTLWCMMVAVVHYVPRRCYTTPLGAKDEWPVLEAIPMSLQPLTTPLLLLPLYPSAWLCYYGIKLIYNHPTNSHSLLAIYNWLCHCTTGSLGTARFTRILPKLIPVPLSGCGSLDCKIWEEFCAETFFQNVILDVKGAKYIYCKLLAKLSKCLHILSCNSCIFICYWVI